VEVFEGHTRWVRWVCFYPDESKLVSGSDDGTLRIWDRETGTVEVLGGHTDAVRDVGVSRDGKMVVSASDDKTVRIWNEELGKNDAGLRGPRIPGAFSGILARSEQSCIWVL